MPTITIGRMSKKINSMRRTFDAGSTVNISVKLKEKTTEHDPVFILQGLPLNNDYNYCQWGRRRYWINDKVYVTNDIMEFHCNLDVLATYHDSILDGTGFCSFADKAHWSDLVDDPRLGPELELEAKLETYSQFTDILNATHNKTTIVLRTVCTSSAVSSNIPGEYTYIMGYTAWINLLPAIGNEIRTLMTSGSFEQAAKNFMTFMASDSNTESAIRSAYLLPIDINDILACMQLGTDYIPASKILLGMEEVSPQTADPIYRLTDVYSHPVIKQYGKIRIPYPAETYKYRFLRYPKYTSVQIRYPDGMKEINNEILVNCPIIRGSGGTTESRLYYKWVLDLFTGMYDLILLDSPEIPIYDSDYQGSTYGHYTKVAKVVESVSGCCGLNLIDQLSIASLTNASDIVTNLGRAALNVAVGMSLPSGIMSSTQVSSGGSMITTQSHKSFGIETSSDANIINVSPHQTETQRSYRDTGIQGLFRPYQNNFTGNTNTYFTHGLLNVGLQPMEGSGPDPTSGDGDNYMGLHASLMLPSIFTKLENGEVVFDDDSYESYCNEYGWPCNKRLKLGDIGNIPGETGKDYYVKCEGFSWAPQNLVHPELEPLMPTQQDICEVNNLVNSGIYITHDDLLE